VRRSCSARVLSWPWALAAGLRNRAYDRGWLPVHRAELPVVCVGNLAVGGTGKTPLVAALAAELAAGRRPEPLAGVEALAGPPAILSRGYGRRSRGWRLVSEGRGPLLSVEEAGDEPLLLARLCPGVLVAVCEDRVLGARRLAELGAGLVLLDDGFQHRRLARDLDLLVWACGSDPAREALLPFGRLREDPAGALRAGAICYSHAEGAATVDGGSTADGSPAEGADTGNRTQPTGGALAQRRAWFRALFDGARRAMPPEWLVESRLTGFFDEQGRELPPPEAPWGLLCGLGDPRPLLTALSGRIGKPARRLLLPDHGTPTMRQLAEMREQQRRGELGRWVLTGKDAVKLPAGHGLRLAIAGQQVSWRRLDDGGLLA
jgi:tetraacyldisaccharide 4'-kinase